MASTCCRPWDDSGHESWSVGRTSAVGQFLELYGGDRSQPLKGPPPVVNADKILSGIRLYLAPAAVR